MCQIIKKFSQSRAHVHKRTFATRQLTFYKVLLEGQFHKVPVSDFLCNNNVTESKTWNWCILYVTNRLIF